MAEENEWFLLFSDYPGLSGCRLELLPDTCFWKRRLQDYISKKKYLRMLNLPDHNIYIFSGPAGNGRHRTGSALAGSLMASLRMEADETAFLVLRSDDFPDGMEPSEVSRQMESILENHEDAPLRILVLDAMESYAHLPAVSNAIADYMEQLEEESEELTEEERPHLIVIGYITDEDLLTFDLRSQALILRLPNPSDKQREEYLTSHLTWTTANPENPGLQVDVTLELEDFPVEELTEQTDGMSYSELEQLIGYLKLAGMERLRDGGIVLDLTCGRDLAEECIHMVKRRRFTAESIPMQIPVIQAAAANADAPTFSGENGSRAEEDRALALAAKKDRSFSENLELIEFASKL